METRALSSPLAEAMRALWSWAIIPWERSPRQGVVLLVSHHKGVALCVGLWCASPGLALEPRSSRSGSGGWGFFGTAAWPHQRGVHLACIQCWGSPRSGGHLEIPHLRGGPLKGAGCGTSLSQAK